MPRRNRPPSYRHYKPKDLAVVRIKGKDHYLGKYDSPESWREYYRLIADPPRATFEQWDSPLGEVFQATHLRWK